MITLACYKNYSCLNYRTIFLSWQFIQIKFNLSIKKNYLHAFIRLKKKKRKMKTNFSINDYINPIIKKYNPPLSERVVLKKTAKFYDFLYNCMDTSYTPDFLQREVERCNGITKLILKDSYGIYHSPQYRELREHLTKLFANAKLHKLAERMQHFKDKTTLYMNIKEIKHVDTTVKLMLETLKDEKLARRITRLLAKYLPPTH